MAAHITVLFPFLPLERIGSEELHALRQLFACADAVAVRFAAFGSFPKVLYLRPEPTAPLAGLTASVAGRWPEAPPYEGAFAEVVPHLTVGMGITGAVAAEIKRDIRQNLPFETVLREVRLVAFAAGRWSPVETFSLGNTQTAM